MAMRLKMAEQLKTIGIAALAAASLSLASCSEEPPTTDPEFRSQMETISVGDIETALATKAQSIGVTGAAVTVLEGDAEPITYHVGRSKPGLQFQAASMSKTVAAAVILTLAEQNGVGLDDDIRGQIASLEGASILPQGRSVTLRQLLSSTSGASVHGFDGYAIGDALPTTMETVTNPPGLFKAGVNFDGEPGLFDYSGGGFMVAQLWAEDVAGEAFPALAARLILDPLEMENSTFSQTSEATPEQVAMRVGADGDGLENSWRNYPEHAAAGLWTTSQDYAKFAMALLNAAPGEPLPISSSVAKAMTSPQVQLQGQTHYGLGTQLYLDDDGTPRYISHSGGNAGYRTVFSSSPASGGCPARVVVALSNAPSGAGFTQDVVYGLVDRRVPLSPPFVTSPRSQAQ